MSTSTAIDTSRYVYIPGVTPVLDDNDIDLDSLGLHDLVGDPITEASLERDADEAERRQRAGLIPGGKSLSGGSTHSPRFQVILGEKTAADLRERANQANMSVSRYLRRIVEEKLAA